MSSQALIGELFEFRKGKKPNKLLDVLPRGGREFLQIDHLRGIGPKVYVADTQGTLVDQDDICIVWDGANAGLVGYGLRGFIGSTITRLRPIKKNYMYTPYVAKFLQNQFHYLNSSSQGAAIPHVDGIRLKNLKVFLPAMAEQKRIAAILNQVDALCKKREKTIALMDDLMRSVFLDLFGDPIKNKWELKTLEELASSEKGSIRTGPFGSQLLHSEFTSEGIAVLGIDNAVKNVFQWGKPRFISEAKYNGLKRYTVKPGDLLFTIMGTCGRAAIVPQDFPVAINTKHLCCVTLNRSACTPEYLHSYFLMHPISRNYLSKSTKGAIMDGLNMEIIKQLPVYLPSINLQKKYSEICKKIQLKKNKLSNVADHYQNMTLSLTHQFFHGHHG